MRRYTSGHLSGQNRWHEMASVWPKISTAVKPSPHSRLNLADPVRQRRPAVDQHLQAARIGAQPVGIQHWASAAAMAGDPPHSAVTASG